jgi:hypothetical protein
VGEEVCRYRNDIAVHEVAKMDLVLEILVFPTG